MSITKSLILAIVIWLAGVGGGRLVSSNDPVQTVDEVDLERYDGLWYEIAKTPNLFEIGCTCTTATYSQLSETTIGVLNGCNRVRPQGPLSLIRGIASVANPEEPGKLRLVFEEVPFPSDYWIVDLVENPADPEGDYLYAAVGGPDRDFIFIISRKPNLTTTQDKRAVLGIVNRLRDQHFPIEELELSPQPNSCTYEERDFF